MPNVPYVHTTPPGRDTDIPKVSTDTWCRVDNIPVGGRIILRVLCSCEYCHGWLCLVVICCDMAVRSISCSHTLWLINLASINLSPSLFHTPLLLLPPSPPSPLGSWSARHSHHSIWTGLWFCSSGHHGTSHTDVDDVHR